jgi:dihydrofolate synthase/folylpolyglutamate synthase
MRSPYREALDYLYRFTDYGKLSGYTYSADRFDLDRVRQLLALLDNPQRQFRAVHVAGTKGKGSTSAMIASILLQAGYHTGLYTSPHLHSFRERIQLDGDMIPESAVAEGVERLRTVAPQVPDITTFELITALAFDYLGREQAEWAVLEVGMGGRLDATNVITPQVAVITPISHDHMMYLGDTLAAIAAEKAGIIKPGVPIISAPQHPEAAEVIARTAQERNAPLIIVGQDWQWQSLQVSHKGQTFKAWQGDDGSNAATYVLPLLGRHQQVNAVTALATVAQMRHQGVDIPHAAARDGLASVRWPGRLEVLGQHPWVIVDGAHNDDSMQKLRAALAELFPHKKLTLIVGMSGDKDIDGMLDAILPAADHILVTQAHHPRAADSQQLVQAIEERDRRAQIVPIDAALQQALSIAQRDDLVCATGSLFVVAELRAAWFRQECHPLPPSDTE